MPRASLLHRTSLLSVLDVRCDPGPLAVSDFEEEPAFSVVLPRRGVYVQEVAGKTVVADPTVAVFLHRGCRHRTTHPTLDGDHNTDIALSEAAAEPFLDRRGVFPVLSRPVATTAFIRNRQVAAAIASGAVTDLDVDEWAVTLVADLLAMPAPNPGRRLIDDTRAYLAASYTSGFQLGELARAVGSSPHHLSRSFRSVTGSTISRHRTELRMRHAIDLIAQGAADLSRVAVDAGFYDHAHMTRTVKRLSGRTPAALRGMLRSTGS